MSQILSSIQYIFLRKISGSNKGAPKLLLAPGAIQPRYAPVATAAVAIIALRWRSNASFSFMLLFTLHSTKLRCLPLLAVTVLQHFLPKMSAFNSHMRQNAYDHWTFEDLLPCYCYAIKSNDRTIRSQALQPASAGEVANMSKLQAHHFMIPEQRTYLLCSVSYRQLYCYCKN